MNGAVIEPTSIRVVLPFPPHALCAQHLLIEPLGYAADEGLSVSVDFTESPLDASRSVAAGNHDVTEVNMVFAFLLREQNIPVKAFYAAVRQTYRRFAVPRDSSIVAVDQLKGCRVGTDHPDLKSLAGPVLADAGLDAERDILWVTDYLRDVHPTEEDLAQLRSGMLDAIWTLADSEAMVAAEGIPLRKLPAATLDSLTPSACLYARAASLASDERDMLAAYGRCIARTTAFCAENAEEAVSLVWNHYPDARPDGDRERAFARDVAAVRARVATGGLEHGRIPLWGAMTPDEIDTWQDWLLKHRVVTERRAATEYADFELVRAFNAWEGAPTLASRTAAMQ